MASLPTLDNVQYFFDPSNVAAISDHDPSTGAATTCVYGLSASGYVTIGETVQQFMTRLDISEKFAKLTRPDGTPIWINGSSMSSIRPRVASDKSGANAVLSFSSMPPQWVSETAVVAAAALKLA